MTRQEAVKQAVTYSHHHKNIVLEWATGVGKSKAALEIIDSELKISKKLNLKILLLVAEIDHKNNWSKEFIKWDKDYLLNQTTIICYNSLKNYTNTTWDIIILDEGHRSNTTLRLEYFSTIKTSKIILLSATVTVDTIYTLKHIYGNFKVFTITLQEAINWGIIPAPKIYLIPLQLEDTNYNQTLIEEWGIKNKRITYKCRYEDIYKYLNNRSLYPNSKLIVSCTQKQAYTHITQQINYYKTRFMQSGQISDRNIWLLKCSTRKRYLGEFKTNYMKLLISKLKNIRYICFCSSIHQAEILGKENCIHSKKKDSSGIINKFNNGEIDTLYTVKKIQEGQNLTNIQAGIIIQLDGAMGAFIQKMGRSLRSTDPIQFILYYTNTRDSEYLEKNVLNEINPNYIYYINNLLEFKI